MTLDQQVCSLELAQKLKALEVKQEGLYEWVYAYHALSNIKEYDIYPTDTYDNVNTKFTAFTVAELGELLPPLLKIDENFWYLVDEKLDGNWTLSFQMRDYHKTTEVVWKFLDGATVLEKTEADARAKMLIYLLESKLI